MPSKRPDVMRVEDDLRAAFEAVESQSLEFHPCQVGQHTIHPKAATTPGVYPCGVCGAPVDVPVPLGSLVGRRVVISAERERGSVRPITDTTDGPTTEADV